MMSQSKQIIIQIGLTFLIVLGGSGIGKTNNVLLNLIKHQRPDIDESYLYIKDPLELKYRLLINGR